MTADSGAKHWIRLTTEADRVEIVEIGHRALDYRKQHLRQGMLGVKPHASSITQKWPNSAAGAICHPMAKR